MEQVREEKGVRVGGLVVDPCAKTNAPLVITHAHADHVNLASEGPAFLSPATLALVRARFGQVKNPRPLPYKRKARADGVRLSLHDAGHVLGSAQVLVETGDGAVAVTSDFKLEASLTGAGAEPLDADVLVLESTYGHPRYRFPPREEVYDAMAAWARRQLRAGRLVVLAGYALGKAQELVAFSNHYLSIEPFVHASAVPACRVYARAGVRLGGFCPLHENAHEAEVIVLPPHLLSHDLLEGLAVSAGRGVAVARATGWPRRGGPGRVFALSDHADFGGLLAYAEACAPRLVYTTHGFDAALARCIHKRLGIASSPLSRARAGQRTLSL